MYLCGTVAANLKAKGKYAIVVDCSIIQVVLSTSIDIAGAFPVGRMLSIQIEPMEGAPVARKASSSHVQSPGSRAK